MLETTQPTYLVKLLSQLGDEVLDAVFELLQNVQLVEIRSRELLAQGNADVHLKEHTSRTKATLGLCMCFISDSIITRERTAAVKLLF